MIHNIENARYLTDPQWQALMRIVGDNSPMNLHMPTGVGCPVDLTFKGKNYVIKADGEIV